MSIAVALICEGGQRIIAICDRVVDTGVSRAELDVTKGHAVHRRWILLMAGDNTGAGLAVRDELRQRLAKKTLSAEAVQAALGEVFSVVRLRAAEEAILPQHGISLVEWRRTHKKSRSPRMGDERLAADFAAFRVRSSLLLAGFDARGEPHLFSVQDPGTTQRHDALAFHSIGAGAWSAHHQLIRRNCGRNLSMVSALVYGIEAAMFSSGDPRGLRALDISLLHAGARPTPLGDEAVRELTAMVEHSTRVSLRPAHAARIQRLASPKQ